MEENSNKKLIVDSERLMALVKARPVLYNFNLKDYHNQETINRLWKEIAEELDISAASCKAKWHSLRAAYTRYIREFKKRQNGPSTKRKKWHLADAMEFLEKYIGPQRKIPNYLTSFEDTTSNESTEARERSIEEHELVDYEEGDNEMVNFEDPTLTITTTSPQGTKKRKDFFPHAERCVTPIASYYSTAPVQSQVMEDPTFTFFRSLIPDVKRLNPRRQRAFKAKVLETLNSLLDSQEDESEMT